MGLRYGAEVRKAMGPRNNFSEARDQGISQGLQKASKPSEERKKALIDAQKTLQKLNPDNDEDLSEEEMLWLRDHGRLPKHLQDSLRHHPVTFGVEGSDVRVSNDPNALAENQLQSSGLFQDLVDRRAKELAAQMLREQQQGVVNVLGGPSTGRAGNEPVEVLQGSNPEPDNSALSGGGEEQDQDVPPYNQWPANDLRAEAANRGLDISGNKAALVQRLEENDREEEPKTEGEGGGESNQGGNGGNGGS